MLRFCEVSCFVVFVSCFGRGVVSCSFVMFRAMLCSFVFVCVFLFFKMFRDVSCSFEFL